MLGSTHVYYIWYGNWSQPQDSSAIPILQDFVSSVGGSPYFAIDTTYYDSTSTRIANSVFFKKAVNDNYSQGQVLSDDSVHKIVALAIAVGRLPNDPNGVYFVLTSPDVIEQSGFTTLYCGWHSYTTIGTTNIKYAFVGDARTQGLNSCAVQTTNSPNGNPSADAMASIIAHELVESVSDPLLSAWFDSSGNENADKCAWTFGTEYSSNSSRANVKLGGRDYLIQQNWVNASGGYCALSVVGPARLTYRTQIGALLPGQSALRVLIADDTGLFVDHEVTGILDPLFVFWAAQSGVQVVRADFRGSGFTDIAVFGGPCPELLIEADNGDGTYTLRVNNVPRFVAEAQVPGSIPRSQLPVSVPSDASSRAAQTSLIVATVMSP